MNKLIAALLSVLIISIVAYGAMLLFGVVPIETDYGYWHHGRGFAWHGIGMGLFWIVIIIVGMMFFNESNKSESKSAMDTIKQRYARGEIDKDTYKKMRATLEND